MGAAPKRDAVPEGEMSVGLYETTGFCWSTGHVARKLVLLLLLPPLLLIPRTFATTTGPFPSSAKYVSDKRFRAALGGFV